MAALNRKRGVKTAANFWKSVSPMLNVGIVGIGFMGWIHYLAYQQVRGVRVAAICTRDRKKLAGDWRGIKGNFGPPGAKVDLSGVKTYDNFDAMLADPELDVIDICLPAKLHCDSAVAAFQAGKHVFCEKPIALAPGDAKKMLRAAAVAKRQLLIGHVLPFLPEYAYVLAAVHRGKYGKLLGGHFRRVIADPKWIPDYYNPDATGGPLVDLHIHDAHFIRLLFGQPRAVFSRGRMHGANSKSPTVEYVETQFISDDPTQVVSAAGGVIEQQGRAFQQAFEIHFEKATLAYDFAVLDGQPHVAMPLSVLEGSGKVRQPRLGSSDPTAGFVAEVQEMVRSIDRGEPSPILSGQLAADALRICHMETKSVRTGKLVRV
jgi:predicted dehydrogenase